MRPLYLLSLAACIIVCNASAFAQDDDVTFWDWVGQYDHGFGIEYYTVRGAIRSFNGFDEPFDIDYVGLGTLYGFYYPFMRLDKDLSWGIQPNFVGATGLSMAKGQFLLALSIPIHLMIKYGTDAEYYGKKKFGLGVGVGYRVAGSLMSFSERNGFIGIYTSPMAIVEMSAKAGKLGLLKTRFMASFGGSTVDVPLGEDRLDEFAGTFDISYYGLYFTITKDF